MLSQRNETVSAESQQQPLYTLQLHHCCASRKNKTLPPGRKSAARTGKNKTKELLNREGLDLQKNINDSSVCVLPSSGGVFIPNTPDVQIICCICLCVCVREAGKFPAGPFAISYAYFPQSCFIVCLLQGQQTRMQPKYIEALFMLAADGWSLGRDPEDPGSVRSHCLESNQTPVKIPQNYHVGK